MRAPDELRELTEEYLADLALTPELSGLETALRYALDGGGKRIRPVLVLATAEAAGSSVEDALPAAAALELVHTFSLVHDDLPCMDDDEERRGRPSTWAQFGEGVALLAGDALLAEAFRLAIGGQYLDIGRADIDLAELHRLKTGRLFAAAIGLGLWAARVPAAEQAPWRAFSEELGLLFQVVDDVLDGDGYVLRLGADGARALAAESATRARDRLGAIAADTSVLGEIVDGLAVRTA
jgi:geranylgeranyl diphosphate synthase, type II